MKVLFFMASVFLGVGAFGQNIPAHLPKEGLVAWFPFSGNAEDRLGNFSGVRVNGATLTSNRNSNQNDAYRFDGIDDYIIIPHSNLLNSKSYTISFWVQKLGSGTNGKAYWTLISKNSTGSRFNDPFHVGYTSSSSSEAYFSNYPDQLFSDIGGGSSGNEITQFSGIQIPDGEWYNIIIVYDRNIKKTSSYVNGKLANQDQIAFDAINNFSDINIGRWEGYLNYFKGDVDDLAIWNRALKSAEIISYLKTEGKDVNSQVQIPTGNTIALTPQTNQSKTKSESYDLKTAKEKTPKPIERKKPVGSSGYSFCRDIGDGEIVQITLHSNGRGKMEWKKNGTVTDTKTCTWGGGTQLADGQSQSIRLRLIFQDGALTLESVVNGWRETIALVDANYRQYKRCY